jgi:hypothetical protein
MLALDQGWLALQRYIHPREYVPKEGVMWKVAIVVHIVVMTVLMGALVIAITSIPALYDQGMKLIPIAAAIGFVAAIPVSVHISRRILALTSGA